MARPPWGGQGQAARAHGKVKEMPSANFSREEEEEWGKQRERQSPERQGRGSGGENGES